MRNTTLLDPNLRPVYISAYEQGRKARIHGLPIDQPPPFRAMLDQQRWQEGWTFQNGVEQMKEGE